MSKPEGSPTPEKKQQPQQSSKPEKAGSYVPGYCAAAGCKASDKRFTFCEEHYEQFKFGLIKKSGEPVSDYEKKIEHYQAYKARQGARKAA